MRAYGDAPPRRHRKVCIRVREEKAELAGEAHLPHALWGRHGCSRGHGEEDGHEQTALRSQPRLPAGRECHSMVTSLVYVLVLITQMIHGSLQVV